MRHSWHEKFLTHRRRDNHELAVETVDAAASLAMRGIEVDGGFLGGVIGESENLPDLVDQKP